METWIVWLILLVVLVIIELSTYWLTTFCLAVGCVGALMAYFMDGSLTIQIMVLAFVAILAFVIAGPYFRKRYEKDGHESKRQSNMDALVGREAVVTTPITDVPGRVKIDGDSWQAVAENNQHILAGESVVVVSYDSILLTVRNK